MKEADDCLAFFRRIDLKEVKYAYKLGFTFYEKDPLDIEQVKAKFDSGQKCGVETSTLII